MSLPICRNVCAYGQRRWFLFPPPLTTYTNMPITEWVETVYPTLKVEEKPLECMQRSTDIIFVPAWYGHGTLTVQDSVGVAVELGLFTPFISRFPHLRPWADGGAGKRRT